MLLPSSYPLDLTRNATDTEGDVWSFQPSLDKDEVSYMAPRSLSVF